MKRVFYDFYGLNTEFFLIINKLTNYGYIPYLLKYLSSLFYYYLFIPYFFIACLYCLYRIRCSPHYEKEKKFYEYGANLFKAGLCYTLFIISYTLLKYNVNLPRPYCSLSNISFLSIKNFDSERCLSSFPSAHAALTLIISFYIWPYINNLGKFLAILSVILVGTARITLAMHYPADILYGIIIAIFIIFLNEIIYKKIKPIKIYLLRLVFKYLKRFI